MLADPVLAMPRFAKRSIALLVDVCLCVLTVWLAFFLRLDYWVPIVSDQFWEADIAALISIILALPIFVRYGFYRVIFRHSELTAAHTIVRAMAVYGLLYFTAITVIGFTGIPRTVGVMQPILLLLAIGASRALAAFWLGGAYRAILRQSKRPGVLIYGAGYAGRQLAAAMHNSAEMQIIGYLDDDPHLQRQVLNGLPIYDPQDLPLLVETKGVQSVLLALPSINRSRRNAIISKIQQARVAVHSLPSMSALAQGKVSLADLLELDIDDLLGRESVSPNPLLLARNIQGKTVMVTGAGGSIGSEICRQIMKHSPRRLLLVEASEFALYAIHSELESTWLSEPQNLASLEDGTEDQKSSPLIPLIGNVQDTGRMRVLLSTWMPQTIYHAAAYKHVPLVEHNPAEGIKNNTCGTLTVAELAMQYSVSDFVLVSTDKAVRPTNIMGASKRLAEMVLQALAESSPDTSKTRFTMVRFGNVLGSSGSVVPKFRQQIRDGGPVTVTHGEMTRYFMTIPEAAQLVIQAGAMAQGGDVFVLDMGEPVKIIDLARRMIELSGLTVRDESNPDGDIEIEVTGLRPGEKLYEELLIGHNPKGTSHPRIMRAQEDYLEWSELKPLLAELLVASNNNEIGKVKLMLQKLVSGYSPCADIVDWIHLEQDSHHGQALNDTH
ncbi:polysaccharide biosynthesis protein [Orrella marina]|uniref:Polysaccharide biosynthesis protein n=2 Tax=Orrella marina TaxID=2163011 RepID=A0A2R4XPC2_9BURK|nr:polysaccharide biosynthesis protein [Orrella marina]